MFLCNILFISGHLLAKAWRSLVSCQHCILLCCILLNWLLLTNKFIHHTQKHCLEKMKKNP